MEPANDTLVCLEVNGKATYLKESEVPPSLKPFIKPTSPPPVQQPAHTSQQASNSATAASEPSQPDTTTNTSTVNIKGKNKDLEFTKILKKTTFAAATPLDNIKGTNQEKISILDRFFVSNEAYAGAKVSHYKGKHVLLAFFDTQESAQLICNKQIKELDSTTFTIWSRDSIDLEIQQSRLPEQNHTVKAKNIPLSLDYDTVRKAFERYGAVVRMNMVKRPNQFHAYIVYENTKDVKFFETHWSIFILNHAIRTDPIYLSDEFKQQRTEHVLKLSGLPNHTLARDLLDLLKTCNAHACIIPNDRFGTPMRHAFIYFASEDDVIAANTGHDFVYKNQQLFWSSPTQKTCHNCGDFTHLIKDCKEKRRPPPRRPPPPPVRQTGFQQRSWDFTPNPKSYASVARHNTQVHSSLDDSIHNPNNRSVPLPQHFKKDILATFKIITNEITNINNSFIDMKKEFSSLKSQINQMDQRIQRLESVTDFSSTSSPSTSVIIPSVDSALQSQADKIETSIQDTNSRLSGIYASIATLAKSFGAPIAEQRQLQFPSHSSPTSSSNIATQSSNVPDDNNMFVDTKSSLSQQPSKISTNLSFPKSHD